MDYAGLSSLLHLRTDLQKFDLHRFDLQRFPSFLSQPRFSTPASNPMILWQDGGRKSRILLNVDIHPSASIPSAGRLPGPGTGERPGTLSPSLVGRGGRQMGQRGGMELSEQAFLRWRSFGHPSPDPSQLSAGRESALVLPHKVSDGLYTRAYQEPPWKVTALC